MPANKVFPTEALRYMGGAGQYHFEPGVEMQHDTSPHEVEVGGHFGFRFAARRIGNANRSAREIGG